LCYAGSVYTYEDGYYKKIEEAEIVSKIVRTFPTATSPKAGTAYDTFRHLVHRSEFGGEGKTICMLNGTLEVDTRVLRPWDPEDELMYRLDIEWDDNAKCPKYDKFIKWVFGGDKDQIRCWDEFCGLSFVDDVSYQNALFLLGTGANGKSTLTNVLNSIHDNEMVSTVGITELDNERKVSSLLGKLLNISTEQSRINSVTDDVFKKITGGDAISVRKLYEEVQNNITLKVRFLCLANELPSVSDSTEAMRRRLIILRCPNSVPEGERNPRLTEELLSEKSGILKRWVDALASLHKRGKFIIPDSSNEIVNEYIDSSDPILMWANSRIKKSKKNSIDITAAYSDFAEWAKLCGHKGHAALPFWKRRMERLGYPTKMVTLPDGSTVSSMDIELSTNVPGVFGKIDF